MITITRSLARQLRAVFRRVGIRRGSSPAAWIVLMGEGSLLRVRIATPNVAVEHHVAGDFPAEQITLPYEFLADCEGSRSDPVVLEVQSNGKMLVRWSDRGVPQMAVYDSAPPDKVTAFPALPNNVLSNDPGLWQALHDAGQTADTGRTRYALDSLQLRGTRGEITATDGHHVLVQGGYQFPWQADMLVPASAVLGCRELACNEQVAVGNTDDWVVLGIGVWNVFLKIDKEARFPKLDDLFRNFSQATTRLRLSDSDSKFLLNALPRLPEEDRYSRITLDLDGQAIVRAADFEQTTLTELTLSDSQVHGEAILMNTNRNYLARAVQMGFRDVHLFGPNAPAQCEDGRRKYLWAVLDPQGALKSTDKATRIDSRGADASSATIPIPTTSKQRNTMPRTKTIAAQPISSGNSLPQTSATPAEEQGKATATANPIAQAEALRVALRDTLTKTSNLIVSLKRQRRQSKLVQSTLAALQELRTAG